MSPVESALGAAELRERRKVVRRRRRARTMATRRRRKKTAKSLLRSEMVERPPSTPGHRH